MGDATVQAMIRDSLDHCVKCTICETFCPVAAATPLFPGPKYVGPQAERYRDPTGPSPDASLDYCSSCGICTLVCPQGVKIAEINSQARALMKADRGVPLRDRLIARPTLTGRLGTPAAPLANATLRNRLARRLLERTLGIHRSAPMPRWAGRTLQAWAHRTGRRRPPEPGGAGQRRLLPRLRRQLLRARHGTARVEVLEHNGLDVIIPRQGCCGCRCRATASSPTPAATPASWPRRSPPTPGRATTSSPPPRAAA